VFVSPEVLYGATGMRGLGIIPLFPEIRFCYVKTLTLLVQEDTR
jgi:hypothetical protein